MLTAIVFPSSRSLSPIVHSPLLQVLSSTTVVTPSRSPTPNNTPEAGLPPSDSLLFSPNPSAFQLDPLAQSFQSSQYQAAPPPGTWGNAPWGTGWGEAALRSPSPCIFEYGRGGSEPLYLGGTGAESPLEHTDTTDKPQGQDSTTTAATDLLPYDFGVEDLSRTMSG